MRERLVHAGGTRLFMREIGEGEPAVIFENVMGGSLSSWWPVQSEVAKLTRTVSYDRAGIGRSARSERSRDCDFMVEELRSMLLQAQLAPPYLLVGASFGAFNVRVFAHRYPGEVAGLVLAEPSHEDYLAVLKQSKPDHEWLTYIESANRFARMGGAGFNDEWEQMNVNSDKVRSMPLPDHIPVVVISSTRYGEIERTLHGLKPEDVDRRVQLHRSWCQGRKNVQHVITSNSGHHIIGDEPELITSNITMMLKSLSNT